MGERIVFSKNGAETTPYPHKKNKVGPLPWHRTQKINSEWIIGLNMIQENYKTHKKTEVNLCDIYGVS